MFWDIRTGQAMGLVQGHANSVISLDLDRTNTLLATGSGDTTARACGWPCVLPLIHLNIMHREGQHDLNESPVCSESGH